MAHIIERGFHINNRRLPVKHQDRSRGQCGIIASLVGFNLSGVILKYFQLMAFFVLDGKDPIGTLLT